MNVQKNVIANYIGHGLRGFVAIAFIPLYIKYVGIEAFGLIGIFAILQSCLTVLDMGMAPTLGREMARLTGGVLAIQAIRNLLRSVEIVMISVACVISLCIGTASTWLASNWLNSTNIPIDELARCITLMGCIAALRLVEDIYHSCLTGLQLQLQSNIVATTAALVRAMGAITILAWISPTIEAFFIWQVLVSMMTVATFAAVLYRALPPGSSAAIFSLASLTNIWRFAAGLTTIAFLALLLTQLDKLLLSRLLPLTEFGQYALASAISNSLYLFIIPITTACYPKFTELVAQQANSELKTIYHLGAQLVTVITGSLAIMLIVFGDRLLLLWTADSLLTLQITPLLAVLSLGTLLNGLNWIPYHLQLANAWTALGIKINVVAVAVLVPAIFWIVPRYGAIGAAWVWVTLNGSYLIFTIYFMHRRLLQNEKWPWYSRDIATPLLSATVAAAACILILPIRKNTFAELITLLAIFASVLITAALSAPLVRDRIFRLASR